MSEHWAVGIMRVPLFRHPIIPTNVKICRGNEMSE